jgi:hypothetical protein
MAMTTDSSSATTAILGIHRAPGENSKPNQETANKEPAHWKIPFRSLEVPTGYGHLFKAAVAARD